MKLIDIILTGILSSVGLADNPFGAKLKQIRRESNEEKLSQDWLKVARDFRNAYERETKQIAEAGK